MPPSPELGWGELLWPGCAGGAGATLGSTLHPRELGAGQSRHRQLLWLLSNSQTRISGTGREMRGDAGYSPLHPPGIPLPSWGPPVVSQHLGMVQGKSGVCGQHQGWKNGWNCRCCWKTPQIWGVGCSCEQGRDPQFPKGLCLGTAPLELQWTLGGMWCPAIRTLPCHPHPLFLTLTLTILTLLQSQALSRLGMFCSPWKHTRGAAPQLQHPCRPSIPFPTPN